MSGTDNETISQPDVLIDIGPPVIETECDYKILCHIHEFRDMKCCSEAKDGAIPNPSFTVSVWDDEEMTEQVPSSPNGGAFSGTVDSICSIDFHVETEDDIINGELCIKVHDDNARTLWQNMKGGTSSSNLIGSFNFSLEDIYNQMPNHEYYHQWIGLTNTSSSHVRLGIVGYVKVTVCVLNITKGERQKFRTLQDIEKELDQTFSESDVLLPPDSKSERYRLRCFIKKAMGLPKMDSVFEGGQIDPFVTLEFNNGMTRTSVKKNNRNPEFNEMLQLLVILPARTTKRDDLMESGGQPITMYLKDEDTFSNAVCGKIKVPSFEGILRRTKLLKKMLSDLKDSSNATKVLVDQINDLDEQQVEKILSVSKFLPPKPKEGSYTIMASTLYEVSVVKEIFRMIEEEPSWRPYALVEGRKDIEFWKYLPHADEKFPSKIWFEKHVFPVFPAKTEEKVEEEEKKEKETLGKPVKYKEILDCCSCKNNKNTVYCGNTIAPHLHSECPFVFFNDYPTFKLFLRKCILLLNAPSFHNPIEVPLPRRRNCAQRETSLLRAELFEILLFRLDLPDLGIKITSAPCNTGPCFDYKKQKCFPRARMREVQKWVTPKNPIENQNSKKVEKLKKLIKRKFEGPQLYHMYSSQLEIQNAKTKQMQTGRIEEVMCRGTVQMSINVNKPDEHGPSEKDYDLLFINVNKPDEHGPSEKDYDLLRSPVPLKDLEGSDTNKAGKESPNEKEVKESPNEKEVLMRMIDQDVKDMYDCSYRVRIEIYEGSEISCGMPNVSKVGKGEIALNEIPQVKIEIYVGTTEIYKTEFAEVDSNGHVSFHELEEKLLENLPKDPHLIPDIFIYVSNSLSERVSYRRFEVAGVFPNLRLVRKTGSLHEVKRPQWLELKEDPSVNKISYGEFPGFLLLNIAMVRVEKPIPIRSWGGKNTPKRQKTGTISIASPYIPRERDFRDG